jgi:hypothetical protein
MPLRRSKLRRAALRELILSLNDEAQKVRYRKILEEKRLQFNLLMERGQHKGKKK